MHKKCLIVLFLCIPAFLVFSKESQAMPNFARKYGADCSMCHTAVPKLNSLGYEFRLAGYRLPSGIGEAEEAFKLGDFFAARLQEQFTYKHHNDAAPGKDFNSNQLEFKEFTIYPLTGAWGKYFASLGEFSMSPDDVFEIENAFVRGVYGGETGWAQARIGVMHPWEGFGASDRPISLSRPLFQKVPAVGSPFFLWNLDEVAAEVGYHFAKTETTVAARVSNGILWKEDGSGKAEPAQGGELTKPGNVTGRNDKSFQFFANQFFAEESAVSLYFYRGVVPFPDPNHIPAAPVTTRDTFWRLAAYANYFVLPEKLNLLAGYERGHDSLDNSSVSTPDGAQVGSQVGSSEGVFGEVNFHVTPQLAFAARYDWYDPSKDVSHNSQTAFTFAGNWRIWGGLQFIGEFQHKDADRAAGGTNKDDSLQARLIFIW
ncbi:MAG: hypothetical protein ACE5IQ_11995 [Candidatus Methylomirabilales bacterium]